MSLINDALKRAQESQKKNSPSGIAPLRPVEGGSHGGIGWMIPAAAILFLATAGIFIALALHKNKTPAVATGQKNSAPQSAVVAPAPVASVQPVSNTNASSSPGASPDLPKLQGIMYDATRPVAILDGQSVSVGDRAGGFHVKEITKTTVTLEADDGSQKQLELGQ